MSVIEENEISIDDNNNDETDDGKITKTKPKKPRTEAQMNAFKEVMKKRAENIEIKKHEKLIKASEILVNNSKKEVKTKEFMKQVKPPVYETSSSEEEIIIVKAKPKKKKKKRLSLKIAVLIQVVMIAMVEEVNTRNRNKFQYSVRYLNQFLIQMTIFYNIIVIYK